MKILLFSWKSVKSKLKDNVRLALIVKIFAYSLVCSFLFVGSAWADEKVVILSSLEWPPYTGEKLPDKGRSSKRVSAAFAAMGYKVEFRFAPWKRAIRSVQKNKDIMGYFPEYYSKEKAEEFIFSESIGCSPLGVLVSKKRPIFWDTFQDLAKYKIGLVSGYTNTAELDALVLSGGMDIDYASTDESNIKKLIKGRIRGAVVDCNVYDYISMSKPKLTKYRSQLTFFNKVIGMNKLHVCFKKDEKGCALARIFNEGLKIIGQDDFRDDICK
ncbi:ABC transporter substrate-binding protein [Maridesulfovibrio ferrireducens]|uniref:substrate-binding periplasmic protein n=1 Tax=Maridesulfovibrio ferrireducens TaxID=246191 RepID=UPI001A1F6E9E|nr:transporter substrate-binding domain-containing protein [Maridesulfovibrio ferrireducens]MBI9111879.1 transporter substrate-binding domain-containing protein [Maridesulfovibrio ferrireducens]